MSVEACSLCHVPLFVTHIKIIFMYIKQRKPGLKCLKIYRMLKILLFADFLFFQGVLFLTKYLSAYSVQSV